MSKNKFHTLPTNAVDTNIVEVKSKVNFIKMKI